MVERLAALITRHREPDTEVMRFPPVMNRAQLEKSGYLKSFPNLLGCVCGLHGTEREIHSRGQPLRRRRRLDHVALARRSRAVAGGLLSGLSDRGAPRPAARGRPALRRRRRLLPPRAVAHLDRLQSFRMREYVCIGSPDEVSGFPRALDGRAPARSPRPRPCLHGRHRQRSVLRPRRPDEGGQPEAAIAEIRAADPAARPRNSRPPA